MKILAILIATSLSMSLAWAGDAAPQCLDNNNAVLSMMDQQVIQWKTSTPNQYHARALVEGTVDQVFPDHSGHHHFEIKLGPDAQDTLEVVFNEGFGQTPTIQVGDQIEACGDYITSTAAGGGYPPSPSGALIHWIHQSDSANHKDGFMMVNGVLYGRLGG